MSDHIGGIAILDRKNPANQYLYCYGIRDGKSPVFINLPVYAKGTAKPRECAWEYEIAGDRLNVTPSVRVMSSNSGPDIFHNTYSWAIQFRDKVADAYEELRAANPEIAPGAA